MLISAILLFLGIPLWMIAGMLVLIFWNRNRVKGQTGMFPVKIRAEADPDAEKEPKWSRKGYAWESIRKCYGHGLTTVRSCRWP
jgi:hypothetical protein